MYNRIPFSAGAAKIPVRSKPHFFRTQTERQEIFVKQYIVDAFLGQGIPVGLAFAIPYFGPRPARADDGYITRENTFLETAFAVKKLKTGTIPQLGLSLPGEIDPVRPRHAGGGFLQHLTKIEPQKNTVIFETLSGT